MFKFSIILAASLSFTSGGIIPFRNEQAIQEFIVGGNETKIEEVPYQVALFLGTRFLCGGSIISKNHILTAAHCVLDRTEKITYNIRAGSSRDKTGGVLISAQNINYHPSFSYETIDYDVAVITLSKPLEFSDKIKPIKLADKLPADGELVRASGWGNLKENGVRPDFLQSVFVPMVNRKVCENNYKEYFTITPRMICAGVEGKDSCHGDSGGPLAYKDTLVGIVSFGKGCGRKGFPGIYCNVADTNVRKFIKEHTGL